MILYISIALLTVLAARWGLTKREYREERGTRAAAMSRIAYALIFLVLFIPAALRSNTGNDYLKYVDFMHLIRSNAYVPTETGFNTFVRAVYAASGYVPTKSTYYYLENGKWKKDAERTYSYNSSGKIKKVTYKYSDGYSGWTKYSWKGNFVTKISYKDGGYNSFK